MTLGQVWSSADFDGHNETGFEGGRGSVLAVTAQHAGPDGQFDTADDVAAPLNVLPTAVAIDATLGPACTDVMDRVRPFYSFHPGGANFLFAGGAVRFVSDQISPASYRAHSTIAESDGLLLP